MEDVSERVQSISTAINLLTTDEQRQLARISEDHAVVGQETRELRTICDRLFALADLLVGRLDSRNRKSDPETIDQDKEIYSRRVENPLRWSWNRLAKNFGMTARGVQKAVERHESRLEFQDVIRRWYDQTAPDVPLTKIIAFIDELVSRYQKTK